MQHHPNDSDSELDQEEIMQLKKRLDFIEISNHSATPTGSHGGYMMSGSSTPLLVNSSLFSETNKENSINTIVNRGGAATVITHQKPFVK